MSRNYLLYFDCRDDEIKEVESILKDKFQSENVYRMNCSKNFTVRTDDATTLEKIMIEVGFEDGKRTGLVVEILNGHRNGWYNQNFWNFLKSI